MPKAAMMPPMMRKMRPRGMRMSRPMVTPGSVVRGSRCEGRLSEDEVEDDQHGENGPGQGCRFLPPFEVSFDRLRREGVDEADQFGLRPWSGEQGHRDGNDDVGGAGEDGRP